MTAHGADSDPAYAARHPADAYYADASVIRVMLHDLGTHVAGALLQILPPAEAERARSQSA